MSSSDIMYRLFLKNGVESYRHACTASCNDSHMRIPSTLQEGPQQLLDICDLTENGSRMRQKRIRSVIIMRAVLSTARWHSSGERLG